MKAAGLPIGIFTAYGMSLTGTEAIPQPYRYAQGYTDTTTGLTKLEVHCYDSTNGRFTQKTPAAKNPSTLTPAIAPSPISTPPAWPTA